MPGKIDNKKNPDQPGVKPPIADQVKDKSDLKQKGCTLSAIKISSNGATNTITGSITSDKDQAKLNLEVRMYNSESGRMLGVAGTTLENVTKNTKQDFEISIIGDYSTVDEFKVIVLD